MEPLDETPNKRIVLLADDVLASRDKDLKKRVAAQSPSQGRCIIENRPNPRIDSSLGIQLCHVFGRANSTDDEIMSSIEYRWNMVRGSLNIDTRLNGFNAGGEFHAAYDQGKWCLMPCLKRISTYLAATDGYEGTADPQESLEAVMKEDDGKLHMYTFVALHPDMQHKGILWQVKDIPTSINDYVFYGYPFTGPTVYIESHIHPKFAILGLGQMLNFKPDVLIAASGLPHCGPYLDALFELQTLYTKWTTVPEDLLLNHPSVPQRIIEYEDDLDEPESSSAKSTHDDKEYRGRKPKDLDSLTVVTRRSAKAALALALSNASAMGPPVTPQRNSQAKVATASSVKSAVTQPTANTGSGRIPIMRKRRQVKQKGQKRKAPSSPTESLVESRNSRKQKQSQSGRV